MEKYLKVGVIGLGRLGSLYAEYLAYQIPKASLIAVADFDTERVEEIGDKVGVENVFSDYRDMLELPELDAIVVTTPTSTHKEQKVPGYASWWDVPVAEQSGMKSVNKARKSYEEARKKQRDYL